MNLVYVLGALAATIFSLIYYSLWLGKKKNPQPPSNTPTVPAPVSTPPVIVAAPNTSNMNTKDIYDAAVSELGHKIYSLMTPSVPAADGCAASVSYILEKAGRAVPSSGLLTVNSLIEWMLAHGTEITADQATLGTIITAHMPDNDPRWAHVVIRARWGDMGNTSFPVAGFAAGEFGENYPNDSFERSFTKQGCVIRYFNC